MTSEPEPTSLLTDGLAQLGIKPADALVSKLIEYAFLVLGENESTNLTGRETIGDFIVKDVFDSLAPFALEAPASPLVDVGSGAGLPGIPLALAFPKVEVTLLEPRAKRVAFLARAAEQLSITNVRAIKKTAASYALEGAGKYRCATARAVASADHVFRFAVPLLARDGVLVLYRGREAKPSNVEIGAARNAGAEFVEASRVAVPYLDAMRHVWRFRKNDSASTATAVGRRRRRRS